MNAASVLRAQVDGAPSSLPVPRSALEVAVMALAAHPADVKFQRGLKMTRLTRGAEQEAVAAEPGLPFDTFGCHLACGAERVVRALWQAEQWARQG